MSEIIKPGDPEPEPDYFNDPETQAKVEELKAKLGLTQEAAEAQLDPTNVETPTRGEDVDWSQYDIEPGYAHLYPRAECIDGDWICEVEEFHSISRVLDAGIDKRDSQNRPQSAGAYITYIVGGPEGWKLSAIVPGGVGMVGLIFRRFAKVVLPRPVLLKDAVKDTVEPVSEDDLEKLASAASNWAEEVVKPREENNS